MQKHAYGCKRDLPDGRDVVRAPHPRWRLAAVPPSADLRPGCPEVYDQGQLGSCTGNGIGGAHHYHQLVQSPATAFMPSRLFIYYNERVIENTVAEDAGAQIRDGMKSVARQGVCPETLWAYDPSKFSAPPPPACYAEALKHQVLQYRRVLQTAQDIKSVLAEGDPIVCGITVYESFESDQVAQTGSIPLPDQRGEQCLGGHCVMLVGYDDATRMFVLRNSWGAKWGLAGYAMIPYAYILNSNLASDFWTLSLVEEPGGPTAVKPSWLQRQLARIRTWF